MKGPGFEFRVGFEEKLQARASGTARVDGGTAIRRRCELRAAC